MSSNRPGSKPFVFVLMPFKDEFRDVYESGIKPACEAVGVYCERIDDQKFDETILERIYNQIQAAQIIVADMTGCNPNVFYEVGYAHALHKRVILVTKDVNDIPFDLRHHRHIEYKGKSYVLKGELVEELKWCMRTPPQDVDPWLSRSVVGRITRILGQVSKTVASQLEIQPLLENILDEVTEILDAEVCSIFLNEADSPDVITCVAGSGFAREIVGLAQYNSGEGFTGKVFQRGQTTIIGSSKELEALRQRNEFQGKYDAWQWAAYGGQSQFKNGIAAPLKIGDQTVGVIKVENKRIGEFTATDVSILEAITNGVLSVAIQNARLLQSSRVRKSGRRSMISLIKEFLDANPNPIEPGYVFALLPEKAKPIYDEYVQKAANSLGLRCESLLDFKHPGDALRDVLARIQKAEILVYDISDFTPNVMWELGVGLAIKDAQRVIVIREESDSSVPFNIYSHRVSFQYDPNSEESLNELYKILRDVMQRINKASIRKAPIQSPEVKSLLVNALMTAERKEWLAAEALFETMDTKEPENWYIYNQWGIMHRSKGEFEAAGAKFNQALVYTDFDDEKAFIYTEMAVLHQMSRKYADAQDWFRKAEKADSDNKRLYIAWAEYHDELGDQFSAQAKISEALARLKQDDDPNYKELMLRHSYYDKKINKPDYRKTFEQFKREIGRPEPPTPPGWEDDGHRLPYEIEWDALVDNYVGAVVEGEISNITEYGIFVRLSRQFTGLIFWKHLMEGYREKFSKNEKIKVKIEKVFTSARDQRLKIDLRLVE